MTASTEINCNCEGCPTFYAPGGCTCGACPVHEPQAGAYLPEETSPEPKVGNAATFLCHSDRHACTIFEVVSPTRLVLRRDRAILRNAVDSDQPDALTFTPGGFCGHVSGQQRFTYEPDVDGTFYTVTLRRMKQRDGSVKLRWVEAGSSAKNGRRAVLGCRDEHYDFNF